MRTSGTVLFLALALACDKTGSQSPADAGSGSTGAAQHSLHVRVTGNGQVLSSSPVFSCRGDCRQAFDSSVTMHLAAIPDAGWKFDGWQGACSGTGNCDVAMGNDHDVNASFSAAAPPPPGSDRVTVTFIGTGSGRVTSSPPGLDCPGVCAMTVAAGSTLSLNARADGNSTFAGWGGGCSGTACSLTANSDVTVWANFTANGPPPPPPPPPANACAGVSGPDAVAMQQYVLHPNGAMACVAGLGDRNGLLALPSEFNDPNSHGSLIDFVKNDGTFVREVFSNSESLHPIQEVFGLNSAGDSGHLYPDQPTIRLGEWDVNGNWMGDFILGAKNFATAGADATVVGNVLIAGDLRYGGSPGTFSHQAMMFWGGTSGLVVKWQQPLAAAGPVFGAGVDNLGRTLVITGGSTAGSITAQWFDGDRNGTPLTGEFVLVTGFTAGQNTWFETSPLIGGGLMVRRMDTDYVTGMHATALALVASGTATVSPPPAWMTARPDTRLQMARNGRAYAVLPYGRPNTACTQTVEIVAADGTSCGSRDFPIAAGTCFTQDLMMGFDGTVIQLLPAAMESVTDPIRNYHTCTWRWWTRAAN